MKNVYSYDNYEGDKGIIISDSLEEAKAIYKKEYPNRNIANTQEEYWNNGCFIQEADVLDGTSKLINAFPW